MTLQLDDELVARLDELAADRGISHDELIAKWISTTMTEREYQAAVRKSALKQAEYYRTHTDEIDERTRENWWDEDPLNPKNQAR